MNEAQARTMQHHLSLFTAAAVARRSCHSDEAIEYWADVYRDQGLARLGIRFELFVQMPSAILARLQDADVRRRLREEIGTAEIDCERQVRSTCTRPGANTPQPPRVHDGRLVQPMAPLGRYGRAR